MALTDQKKKFAKAVVMGKTHKESAIYAGYEPKTASQAGSRLVKEKAVASYIEHLKAVKASAGVDSYDFVNENTNAEIKNASSSKDPLAFLLDVMSDESEEKNVRVNAAKAALPYVHGKVGDVGKKESQKDSAAGIANGTLGTGRFSATKAPTRRLN